MLDVMRSSTKSLFAGGFATLVIVALIVVFVFSFGRGSSGFRTRGEETWAAHVNGATITATDFAAAYTNVYREQAARRGGKYTPEQARADGIGQQAVKSLVDDELIAQQAQDLGVVVSDKELADAIARDPQFQQDGKFDWDLYKARVENGYQMSIARFEADARRRLVRLRVLQALLASVAVSDDEVRAQALAQGEKAAITYAKFSAFMFRDQGQVSDAEASAYIQSHAKEIEEAYARDKKTRYTEPAAVKVRAVTAALPPGSGPEQEKAARARIDKAYADVKGGKDFAAVAKEVSDDPASRDKGGDLGFVARGGSIYGKALEDEALKLTPGQLSPVFKDRTGFHFLKAEEARAESQKPLAEVQKAIAQDLLRGQKAREIAQQKAAAALAQARAGKDLKELFPAKKTEPGQFDLASFLTPQAQDTEKFAPSGGYIPALGVVPKLSAAVFALPAAGAVPQAPVEDGDTFYVFKVKERERADPARLDAAALKKTREELEQRKQNDLYASLLERLRKSSRIDENAALVASGPTSSAGTFNPDDE